MNVSIQEKKTEALKRMKQLNIYEPIIADFEKDNLISQSEPPFGACYYVDDEQLEIIKSVEEKYNAFVYFVVYSHTTMGDMYSYLLVSDYKEEWDMEINVNDGIVFSYVYNKDTPEFSEFGSIGIAPTQAGGLKRIW